MEGEEGVGSKAEEEEGEAGREEGEGRGDDRVPLLVAAGEDLQHSVWGCDRRRERRGGEVSERSKEGARGGVRPMQRVGGEREGFH